ncbi:MAG TPA: hypothetical protein VHG89_03580 [Verrucomicrobiae bacterium]|nr:hypothetical protein [Verrucomicrobiae bacterium]
MQATKSKIFLCKFRNCWLIGGFLILCTIRQSSLASLVIMIYHNETMYIAGDSAGTMYNTGERKHTVQKVYPFADNCCASITGFAGYDLTNSAGETGFSMSLPEALGVACAQQLTNSVSLDKKMELIATYVNQAFTRYYDQTRKWTGNAENPEGALLQFVGYNAEKNCFFVNSCELDRTNAIQINLVKEYRGPTDPTPITCQGEAKFLQTLLSGDKPELLNLLSDKFTDTAQQLISTEPVDDTSVRNFILEMYSLHTANSARLGYSQGWVGPPYRIFKITKQNVVELTSETTTATNSILSTNQLHADDDKVIDAVMDKLTKGFMANDYSYAFEVMYTPIIESMGGKEKLLAMVPALKEQMSQLQISMISWESQKPYTYLKGNGRWYAVIPYVSEMTMSGQKVRMSGFQLGIKNDGSEWQFVNGDKVTSDILDTFFPDFPKDFELPKTQRQIE